MEGDITWTGFLVTSNLKHGSNANFTGIFRIDPDIMQIPSLTKVVDYSSCTLRRWEQYVCTVSSWRMTQRVHCMADCSEMRFSPPSKQCVVHVL